MSSESPKSGDVTLVSILSTVTVMWRILNLLHLLSIKMETQPSEFPWYPACSCHLALHSFFKVWRQLPPFFIYFCLFHTFIITFIHIYSPLSYFFIACFAQREKLPWGQRAGIWTWDCHTAGLPTTNWVTLHHKSKSFSHWISFRELWTLKASLWQLLGPWPKYHYLQIWHISLNDDRKNFYCHIGTPGT